MKKNEVEFHSDYGRDARPAVNVKNYGSVYDVELPLELGQVKEAGETEFRDVLTDPGFTHEWLEANLGDDVGLSEFVYEMAWEQLQSIAEDVYGRRVKVYSEGRSGGWAVVDGIADFDTWDAIELGKWARFAKAARALADDIPRQMVESAYLNVYERERDEMAANALGNVARML